LCKDVPSQYIHRKNLSNGVELLEVWFQGYAYHRHRHDTYAICLTRIGVQTFGYRGRSQASTPGKIVVLHPDELHDGQAGTKEGLGYQMLYIDPGLIFEVARTICGTSTSLPFIYPPVIKNNKLLEVITIAFQDATEPLEKDSLITELVECLIESAPCAKPARKPRYLNLTALDRAREFLNSEKTRVVHSWELDNVTGLSRFELARQFRLRFGTSPYRYLLMRRLDFARIQLSTPLPLAEVALEAGFSDQAHFTRMFKAGFGLTPAVYRTLITRKDKRG
jgi:AraC-like DNA-binding protein